jgi:hypothetical protein
MAISNLGELKAQVADWLNREDLTTQIPDFILLGTNRINSDFRSRVIANEEDFELTVPSENQINPINTNLEYEVVTFAVDGRVIPHVTYETYLKQLKDSTYANGCWAYIEGKIFYSGFADVNDPTPSAGGDDVTVRWQGYAVAEWDFNDDANTNLLFAENPQVFLFAALVEASVFLRDEAALQVYQVRYEELMDKIAKSNRRRKVSGGFAVGSVGGDYYFDRSW